MGNEITKIDRQPQNDLAGATGTPFSIAMLAASIPAWVDHHALDASFRTGYGLPVPKGAAPALREAADLHTAALAPSTSAERHDVLMGLRSCTVLKDEHVDEADATLKLLRVHLGDVPLDILQEGCRAYVNVTGKRFFPRSAGEIREFTDPLLYLRRARAVRLAKLAEQSERDDARAAELESDPLTPEAMREIIAAAKLKASSAAMITPAAMREAA